LNEGATASSDDIPNDSSSGAVQLVDFKLVDLCVFVLRYSHIVVVLLQGI
jgi:hypothetical protein